MAVKTYKPNTSARCNMSGNKRTELSSKKPVKALVVARKSQAGRNNQGKITVRHRGGGAKRAIRIVDFRFQGIDGGVVIALQYDPNRSANLALIELPGGGNAYVLATAGMLVGQQLFSTESAEIKEGNRLPLNRIPVGSMICNIE